MDTRNPHGQPMNPENPEVTHEKSDVSVRGIFGFLIGLALCVVLVCFVLAGVFSALRKGFTATRPNVNAMVGTREPAPASLKAAQTIFPEPRLQVDYYGDLSKMRQQWSEEVNGYSWVDKNAGVTRIPIERAIQLTLQRGLPARTPGAAIPTAPSVSATAATAAAVAGAPPPPADLVQQPGGRK